MKTSLKQPAELSCNKCDEEVETLDKLGCHERNQHLESIAAETKELVFADKWVQVHPRSDDKIGTNGVVTEDMEKYPCSYCGINIARKNHQSEHV